MAKKNFFNFCLLLKFVLNAPVLSLFVEQFSTEEDESWQGRSRKLSVIRALVSCRSNEDKSLLLHNNRLCIISPTRRKNSHKLSSCILKVDEALYSPFSFDRRHQSSLLTCILNVSTCL